MTTALTSFVRCKSAQAAPPAAKPPASAAVSGLVGALVGAGLLGGERLINGKKDPHASKDPAARRREVLKRALLGGLIGGAGGAAYGHERQPGGRLSLQDTGPKKPGNAIPAVPATVIGAILGAGALGGSRAITRALDPAEGEDLEEGKDSVWQRALLGAGLGGAAGYGLSWHTRPGGYLGPNVIPNTTIPSGDAGGVSQSGAAAGAAGATKPLSEAELLAEAGRDRLGPNDPVTGAVVGGAGAKLAPSAARVLRGVWEAARTVKVTPQTLLSEFRNQAARHKQLPAAAAQFVDAADAQQRASGVVPNASEVLRAQARGSPTIATDLLRDAQVYRGGSNAPLSYRGKLRTALSNIWRDVTPENIPAGKTTQRAHAGRLLPALSGIVGALWGASNESAAEGYQKQLNAIRSAK